MPKRLKNRNANEWRELLKAHGFVWVNSSGDDEIYKLDGCGVAILVPMRNETIITPTAYDMARKFTICTGKGKKDMIKWWKKNGYGD